MMILRSFSKRLKSTRPKSGPHICAISLNEIKEGETEFVFTRPNKTKVYFNAFVLADYIKKTGDLRDPESQLEFSDADIKRLNLLTSSRLKRCKSNELFRQKSEEINLKFALEGIIGEIFSQCKDIIDESIALDNERGSDSDTDSSGPDFVSEFLRILPEFREEFPKLKQLDEEYAMLTFEQGMRFLKGDPRHQVSDNQYMYKFITRELKQAI